MSDEPTPNLDKEALPTSLELQRPIVFLDIQTTGPDQRTARIVRLSTLRIEPSGTESFRSQLINPMAPISPGASAFHGITDDDVMDARPFNSYAKALVQHLEGCDLAGFGIRRFHLEVLKQEFEYAGIEFLTDDRAVIDPMTIFHKLEPRDFNAAYERYVGTSFDRLTDPNAVVHAVKAIINGQLNQNPELPRLAEALEAWSTGENTENHIDDEGRFTLSDEGDPIINFGRYRGHTLYDLSEADPNYLRWIAGDDSFTEQQRRIAADAAEGIMPEIY